MDPSGRSSSDNGNILKSDTIVGVFVAQTCTTQQCCSQLQMGDEFWFFSLLSLFAPVMEAGTKEVGEKKA